MTDLRILVADSRIAQGLPSTVQDAAVITKIAALLRLTTNSKRQAAA